MDIIKIIIKVIIIEFVPRIYSTNIVSKRDNHGENLKNPCA